RLATCRSASPSSAFTSLPSRRNFTDLPAPLPAVIAKSSSCACALPSPLWGGVGGGVLRQCSPALLAEFPHPRFVASSSRRYSRTGGRGSLAIATKMFSAHHKLVVPARAAHHRFLRPACRHARQNPLCSFRSALACGNAFPTVSAIAIPAISSVQLQSGHCATFGPVAASVWQSRYEASTLAF